VRFRDRRKDGMETNGSGRPSRKGKKRVFAGPYARRRPEFESRGRELAREGGTKECAKCKRTLAISDFGLDRSRSDGVFAYCKACRSRKPERYREHESKRADGLRRCVGCEAWKELSEFGSNAAMPSGMNSKCKHCHILQLYRRKATEDGVRNDLTDAEWRQILVDQDGRCLRCGREFGEDLPPTRDHVIPVSDGGGLTFSNVQALCRPCNASKGRQTIDYRIERMNSCS
jgi:5-methylcytosine-specific restriction endonuclease McrA